MDRKLWCSGLVWALDSRFARRCDCCRRSEQRARKAPASGAASALAGTRFDIGHGQSPQGIQSGESLRQECGQERRLHGVHRGGRYQAVDLFPGNYEVSATKNGFADSDVQKITIASGGSATADLL